MQVHRTVIDGVVQFVPAPHTDIRTATRDIAVATAHGVDPARFLRESWTRSVRGVIRGMHGRTGAGVSQLVGCARGAMHDIVIDARPGSPTFGRVASFLLDDTDMRRLYIPAGCLHGFQALTPTVDTCCRIDSPHDDVGEVVSVRFDDPDLAIRWPLPVGGMEERDLEAGSWTALCARLGVDPRRRTDALGVTNW